MRILRPTLFLAAVTVAATPLLAQGTNCALLGTFANHGPFNDIWGYVAPNGDEYALLCTTSGTVVVDVTNPGTPVETGFFTFGGGTWRDARVYGNYAYITTEQTAGFQILDLTNPNNPTAVGVFGQANSGNAHNACVDLGAGRLYLAGCNTGTPVYDLTSNPANPTFLGFARPGGNSNYFHDLCVENGYAYGSMIYNGVLRIFDANASLPWPSAGLSSSPTPDNFTHNAWPNAAGTVCVTTDERPGGVVRFWDITNKSNPIGLGTFTPNSITIPHNAFIVGDKCHVSWYSEGYRCIDISDPNNPVEVASYDTYPGSTNGFDGCWGVYPFLPSGNILVSDRSTGLYIVKPTAASFSKYGAGCQGSASVPVACASVNGNGGTLSNNTNQYEYSYEVNNAGTLLVESVDIYTASNSGTITRPAHIYLPNGSLPSQTPLASTTITVGSAPGFYKATFNPPVSVTGTFYVSYENSPGGVISNLTSGTAGNGYYRTAVSGSWTLSGLADTPSYNIYCAGGSQQFLTPELGSSGVPSIGSSYDVTLADAASNAPAFIVTGLSNSTYNGQSLPAAITGAPGCDIHAAPQATLLTFTNAAGEASTTFNVPGNPALAGLSLYHQWAIVDAVNSIGIVVSDAGEAQIDV